MRAAAPVLSWRKPLAAAPPQHLQQTAARALLLRSRPARSCCAAAHHLAIAARTHPSLGYDLNFAPASALDSTVFGGVGPGCDEAKLKAQLLGPVSAQAVEDWAAALLAEGITRVVSLLDETELSGFEPPLREQYGKIFVRRAHTSMRTDLVQKVATSTRLP